MVTVDGTITHAAADRLLATFFVDGILYSFNASVNPDTMPFPTNSAQLTYDDVEDLTHAHAVHGRIGTGDFSLNFDNGPKIEGTFSPGVDRAVAINGNGAWETY
jgi:hypothetical protein